MLRLIARALLRGPVTEKAPDADPDGLADLARRVRGAAQARLGRSLAIREVEQSLALILAMLAQLPAGPVRVAVAAQFATDARAGVALVEGFRGDILAWVRIGAGGGVERCHLRDPSWFQWPLLEAAIEGNIVADFPLCNKSFNCSYSGHDL